jgi:hypothetical protein
MTLAYPTQTLFVIILFMLASGVAFWLSLAQGLRSPMRPAWLTLVALVLVAWLGARVAIASNPLSLSFFPISAAFFGLPIVLGLGALLLWPGFREVIRAIPQTWLIGAQAVRIGGFVFVALLDMGRLPPQFALPAGYGDMTVGVLAVVTVFALVHAAPCARAMVLAVNILGLLDFAVALATGSEWLGGFAADLAAAGVSPLYIDYVLIVPSFGVPLYILLHAFSLYQLLWRPAVGRLQVGAVPAR